MPFKSGEKSYLHHRPQRGQQWRTLQAFQPSPIKKPGRLHWLERNLRAQLRDMRVLFRESRLSLILFLLVLLGGALIFRFLYRYPDTLQRPSFGEALYATFAMVFLGFETVLKYPQEWYLQILFFVIPILGLAAIADGVLRFGAALTNKKSRGQKWQVAMASTYREHIIICGMGKVGFRVALELLKFDREVVAIETDPEGRFVDKAKALNIPVIVADARRTESLIKAGIERANAIVPCTDDELTNLDIALDARDQNPDIKVVLRLFDPDLARRVEQGFGIHTAFSTSALAAPVFATAAMRLNVKHSFYVGETLLSLGQITIEPGSQLTGWSIKKLESDLDLSVVCHQAGDIADLHPASDTRLSVDDQILVLATLDTLQLLNVLNLGK